MKKTSADEVVAAAIEAFFAKGFTASTLKDVLDISGVSESTLRRHFDGKLGVFQAVLEVSARGLYERFLIEAGRAKLDTQVSDPKKLVLLYVQTVFDLWNSEGSEKWQIGLLFGADGTSAGQMYGKPLITKPAMLDIDLLDQIITRGCGGDGEKARNASCILLGTISEYVWADIGTSAGYDRKYDAPSVLELLNVLFSAVFKSQHVQLKNLKEGGVTTESLIRLRDDLDRCANAVNRVLKSDE